ncbi:MAG: response regulator [Thermodesulfobacteriota bacterium]
MTVKGKILVVDDEPQVTKIIRRLLQADGHEAIEVNDPRKVEEHILYTDINLVITDLRMPGLDGLEVLKLVRRSKPTVPVLILTGHGAIESAVEATKLGAVEYLSKPIKNQELMEAVKKHLQEESKIPAHISNLVTAISPQRQEAAKADPDRVLLEDEIISTETIPVGFVEIPFEELVPGEKVPFAIYIQIFNKSQKKHVLRRLVEEDDVFHSGIRNILFRRKLGSVFIREQDYRNYLKYYQSYRSTPRFQLERIKDKKKLVLYGKAVEAVTEILTEPVDAKNVQTAVNLVDNIFRTMVKDQDVFQDMYKLFTQDTSIFNHSSNVCLLSVSFGLYLRLKPDAIKVLGLGAMFHDIGMSKVDKDILGKEGPLTQMEWAEIKAHPERGATVLKTSLIYPLPALRIVLEHHEQSDGSGYPKGLAGNQISDLAHICRMVDRFDGLTTKKPYRGKLTPAEALKRIFLDEKSPKNRRIIRRFIEFLSGKK